MRKVQKPFVQNCDAGYLEDLLSVEEQLPCTVAASTAKDSVGQTGIIISPANMHYSFIPSATRMTNFFTSSGLVKNGT